MTRLRIWGRPVSLWDDTLSGGDARRETDRGRFRYVTVAQVDVHGARPFAMAPPPSREDVLRQVRELVTALDGGVDEGSGAALDLLIDSWVASWLAGLEAVHQEHRHTDDVHLGQARQWLEEAAHEHAAAEARLAQLHQDHHDARAHLTGPTSGGTR